MNLSFARKTVVAVLGFVATVLATVLAVGPELIPEGWLPVVHVVLGVLTSVGIYKVRNAGVLYTQRAAEMERRYR